MPIKLLVFFLCTSGTFYQTWGFLQMYLGYPTTLDISEEYPDSFIEPAFTVCNRNRILRQPYCKTYPEECTWEHTTWQSFCDSYRRMCPKTKPPNFNFGIPVSKILDDQNASNAFLNAVGPQEDIIELCKRAGYSEYPPCNSSTTVIQVSENGFPYRCFSLFSLLLKPYEEPSNLNLTDIFGVWLNMQPEEHFNTIDPVQAIVVLHDPRKAVNPMTEGIPLTSGKYYYLFPTMERRESLPPPYASNCIDYLKEWKKNGGSGPLSKDDCIDNCKIKAMVDEYGCVGKTMTYPNEFPICENKDIHASSEASIKCTSSCQDACDFRIIIKERQNDGLSMMFRKAQIEKIYVTHFIEIFGLGIFETYYANEMVILARNDALIEVPWSFNSISTIKYRTSIWTQPLKENIYHVVSDTFVDFRSRYDETDEYLKSQHIIIKVFFNRMKIKKFKQIPRIESIELFSYIGGYLGMWLGISLSAVFDLGEMLYDVIAFLKRKRNQKTTTPIEQLRHHTAVQK